MDRHLLSRSLAFALLAIAIVYVVLNRSGIAAIAEPDSVWMAIFASEEVVVATRLAIIAGALYATASFLGLVIEGRWLAKAGPSGAEADPAQILYRADTSTVEEVEHLRYRLDRLEGDVRELDIDMEEAFAIIDSEETGEGDVG